MISTNALDEAIATIKTTTKNVTDSYDTFIREKAITKVNEKIQARGLHVDQIKDEDYEVMVNDLSREIKKKYATKASQGLLAFIGLDFFLGW